MSRIGFGMGSIIQKRLTVERAGNHLGNLKFAFGEGTGFVKHKDLGIAQSLQIVAPLYQNTVFRGAADPCEKTHWDRDNKRAGTGNHQKHQRTPDVIRPAAAQNQWRKNGDRRGDQNNGGGIPSGEPGDELFRPGLVGSGVFHQLQDFGSGGFSEGFCHLHLQSTALVDTAGQHITAHSHFPGHGLTGERGGVNLGTAFHNNTVQWDAFAWPHQNEIAWEYLFRVTGADLTVLDAVRAVRADVHKRRNRFAGVADCQSLEVLSHLIKEHHSDALGVFSQQKSANACDRHEKSFVKDFSPKNIFYRFEQYFPSGGEIG
ncbi:hypothetical protein SDC9_77365 [bioreactor metagenome]|uniref:Uncharacterized protein n=1 Tax=bioreactor metagenome TaxID=1076179 RepID=A0A644YQD8_9ZZZZ